MFSCGKNVRFIPSQQKVNNTLHQLLQTTGPQVKHDVYFEKQSAAAYSDNSSGPLQQSFNLSVACKIPGQKSADTTTRTQDVCREAGQAEKASIGI